ncbi:GNAT family N-acetyltransferase [Thalassospira australica]|uniref:GNAT family N-acetyltransferase n=1 Tax=Thalassospira australica TaxID=1528106 RepID=UPI00384DAB99
MEMAFDIRKATNRDGDQIAILIDAVFADYPGCIFDRGSEFPELDAIADDFSGDHGCIWVVEGARGILGCLGLKYDPVQKQAELHKVYLDRKTRGQGIAQRMLQTALDWLAQTHPDCVDLVLWTDTRFTAGHRFYEKCGFARTGGTRTLDDLSASSEYQFAARPGDVRFRIR